MKAGLLPPTDFQTGVTWSTTSPSTVLDAKTITNDSGCHFLVFGGARGPEIATADLSSGVQTDIKIIYERASQYGPGGAATALSGLEDQGHGKCASFHHTLPYGEVVADTVTVTPVTGLGDKADQFVMMTTLPSGGVPGEQDTVIAEYGDVLITVSCDGTSSFLQSCDLDAKAKKIAGQLKLI